ncbi:MmgE/PrpD family protein [Neomoorella mulderi]|uniref:2-methylcitrate dehydratase n=1 Tax=Moorella mulderi DSM 14980 TaxID=1122241 RepID=A0A151AVT8_9FIRM|nr:MmgE/PrpD family protein [Moorella mulderi]KYH31765.1 2-methylcitrate dehydratase [Moorella mulderi DSM 14980]
MPFDHSIEVMADYAYSLTYEDLPESTVRSAKYKWIDSIGCALGAFHAEPCKIVRRLCFDTGNPLTARVIGTLTRTSPEMACFANCVMVRYLDFNDSLRIKDAGHPSDTIPAVLAIGEALHVDGKSLITATALAYEICYRFIAQTPLDKLGWDQTNYIGVGSALAVGKLMGLNKEQLANTAALALTNTVGTYQCRVGELSMWKACSAGMACYQGILAAMMAREGMTGPEEAMEGEYGMMNMVTGKISIEPLSKGTPFGIEKFMLKKYPVRDSCQMPIDTALELRKKVNPNEIKSLKVEMFESAMRTAVNRKQLWQPKTRETADHSIPFSIAAALLDGYVTPETFARERFLDQDVLDLLSRMTIEENPEFTKQTPGKRNIRMEATTYSGEKIVVHNCWTLEDVGREWPPEQLEAKFEGLARDILTPKQTRDTLDMLWHLEDLDDAARILDNLQA